MGCLDSHAACKNLGEDDEALECNSGDPLNWGAFAGALRGSHYSLVKKLVRDSRSGSVILTGSTLTIGEVTAVARSLSGVEVSLAPENKARVEASATWVIESTKSGVDSYGVTTGFGGTSHRRTKEANALQRELIRFLNAGVVEEAAPPLGVPATRAAMLVRSNTLLQGYSGIRWEVLEEMTGMLNDGVTPVVPLRGSITASGDLMPLSYIAAFLVGEPNAKGVVKDGFTITAAALGRRPIELQAKEGLALVNGTAVAAGLAATVLYDANLFLLLSVVLSAVFCEVISGNPEFGDPVTHMLKHHPGQIEAAAVMSHLLSGSAFVSVKPSHGGDELHKPKQDRYALRTSPQWLGPQIEVVRHATAVVENEINSVNDNPLIDVARGRALHGGNFQGTPVGVSMDNTRLAVAAVGKLVFAQFSELVNDLYSNGLTANLCAGPDPSLDYGFKGAEIAMAAYTSELLFLANPVTTHVQSAEQHNQAVNSLGLISARKTEEAMHLLKLMLSTYTVALCQAVDLRHAEENFKKAVREAVTEAGRKVFPSSKTIPTKLAGVVDDENVFTYIDDPCNVKYPLMQKLTQTVLSTAIASLEHDNDECISIVSKLPTFELELNLSLPARVSAMRAALEKKEAPVGNRIKKSRTWPIYKLVRDDLKTSVLAGGKTPTPGEEIGKVFAAIDDGRFIDPVLACLEGWDGAPHKV